MTNKVIEKQDIAPFIGTMIKQEEEVIGVKRKDGKYVFDRIKSADELCLDYDVTILPPKKYFLPPRETLLKFRVGEQVEVEPWIEAKSRIIIGVHPYDIKAMELLDEAFSTTNPDPNYIRKRQSSTIIGVDCLNPSPNAFCSSMGTATTETCFDLLLTDIGDSYVVAIGSAKGEEIIKRYARSREATEEELAKRKAEREKALARYQLSLHMPLEELPALLDKSYDNPFWSTQSESCLSCGSCIMVCPTCFCFDVQDEMELSLAGGERYRQWDGCMLADFAKVATGENFREDKQSRFRHRLYRKGKYVLERFGKSGCVGCGRCITACLAQIANPVEAFNTLKEGC